ncbi:MAG: riboflavin biosynthesis protein RibF [Planctomycetota bacterium]|nr:riboflavin biosynthesis protein RibF [Planctomycetota bacterium]
MRSFTELATLSPGQFRQPVAFTIGVFDGVHQGHQSLLSDLVAWAKEDKGEVGVLTFDRHPRFTLTGKGPSSLTSLENKVQYLAKYGAETVIVLPFDSQWAEVEAEDFLERIAKHIQPEKILLGANHHFGKGRRGDSVLAAKHAERLGYELREFSLLVDNKPISSTRVRKALHAGDLDTVKRLLGRPFSLFGKTIKGDQRGRTIGFPTANLRLAQEALPPVGVYAATTVLQDGREFLSLVNIGHRPTFKENGGLLVEVHLLDFQGDLYGQSLEVQLLSSIRSEKRFENLAALKKQIEDDRLEALERHGLKRA